MLCLHRTLAVPQAEFLLKSRCLALLTVTYVQLIENHDSDNRKTESFTASFCGLCGTFLWRAKSKIPEDPNSETHYTSRFRVNWNREEPIWGSQTCRTFLFVSGQSSLLLYYVCEVPSQSCSCDKLHSIGTVY